MKKDFTVIERIRDYAVRRGDDVAMINPHSDPSAMSYREVFCKAVSLAEYLKDHVSDDHPILVYGHKNPYMLVSFLACTLSGHAYCPVDISMPYERIDMILTQTQSSMILAVENYITDRADCLSLEEIKHICETSVDIIPEIPKSCICGEQTYYIIFTSGSTGVPKGVEISADNLNHFLDWSSKLGEEKSYGEETIFLNQAPFSFDLSVMDVYTSFYCGAVLCMMDKKVQSNLSEITPFLMEHKITSMVVTPSFVNMCLVDKRFHSKNIPTLSNFFFCGETLSNKTAAKLIERFPEAVIQNTYGPTESTVAVSNIRITKEVVQQYDPLPVGKAKKGTKFIIAGDGTAAENSRKIGEILIAGDTLAKGYFKRTDLTDQAFHFYDLNGESVRVYHTGDLGYLENDQLFYIGRMDLQIKLNGYRIEIGDIESSILKMESIDACAVVPRMKNGNVKSLVGVVVWNDTETTPELAVKKVKDHLAKLLPAYMIPSNYLFLNAIPMTNNGKADRKKLSLLIEEES